MTTPQEMLDKYIAAELAILEGKSVSFNGRSLSYENLQEIRSGRKEWEARVAAASVSSAKKSKTIGGLSFAVARFDQ